MVPSFSIFNWIRQLRRLIGFPFRCSVIKADWGSCFVVEVWPLIEGGKQGQLEDKLHDLFRHYGRILFVDVNLRDKKGLVGFSSMPAGLAALEAQVELDGEFLNIVERKASNIRFRQRFEVNKIKHQKISILDPKIKTLKALFSFTSQSEGKYCY